MAETLGVREETVGLWETGRAAPLPRHHGRIVQFLGFDPEPAGQGLPDRLRAVRRRLGLTQAELAARLGQDEGQICRWEGARRKPHAWIASRIELALQTLEGRPQGASPPPTFFDLTRWRRKLPVGVAFQAKTLGEELRARRLRLGMSMQAVAKKAGISRGTLHRLERGRQRAAPQVRRLLELALSAGTRRRQ